MAFTPPPPAPDPNNPATFSALADAFVAWFATHVAELNAAGGIVVGGIIPNFGANMSTAQTLVSGTPTLVQFNTELYDNASQYDPVTNFQYNMTAAGKYHLDAAIKVTATTALTRLEIYIETNAGVTLGGDAIGESGTAATIISCGCNINSNGTQTARVWAVATGTGTITLNAANSTFSGFYTGP